MEALADKMKHKLDSTPINSEAIVESAKKTMDLRKEFPQFRPGTHAEVTQFTCHDTLHWPPHVSGEKNFKLKTFTKGPVTYPHIRGLWSPEDQQIWLFCKGEVYRVAHGNIIGMETL